MDAAAEPGLSAGLAAFNACMNALSCVLLIAARRAIRAREVERHKRLMLVCLGVSGLFLVGYLSRVILFGTHRFPEVGLLKTVYLAILGSHTLLATLNLPLIVTALVFALRRRFSRHRAVVRWAWPIWLYVSVTGVIVYVLLYQVAPRLSV